jgi:hypothetical protein
MKQNQVGNASLCSTPPFSFLDASDTQLKAELQNSNGQKTHEKMLTISSNKGNAN